MAAPVLVAAVTGSDARSTVSKEYGGKSTDEAAAKANPVYNAIGQVWPPTDMSLVIHEMIWPEHQ